MRSGGAHLLSVICTATALLAAQEQRASANAVSATQLAAVARVLQVERLRKELDAAKQRVAELEKEAAVAKQRADDVQKQKDVSPEAG